MDPLTSLSSITTELEIGWKRFDDVYATFGSEQWTRKFGRTWTYADQPYHQAYFDGMVGEYLGYGPNPPADKLTLRSLGDLTEWNRREFAKRRPGQTVEESLAAMRRSREVIRALTAGVTEQDLDRPAWMPLIFGWTNSRGLLQAVIVHNVAEYWKLWLRTGKQTPPPTPAAVHFRLDFMMRFMPASMNRELAARKPFTMTWDFTGPGGGAWTLDVKNGECTVTQSRAPHADLTITMKPEDFHQIVVKMASPPILMLTGKMKVKGFMKMGTFGKLFPEPRPDLVLSPGTGMAAG